jgi:hypothetical protein
MGVLILLDVQTRFRELRLFYIDRKAKKWLAKVLENSGRRTIKIPLTGELT